MGQKSFRGFGKAIGCFGCNAAVYLPRLKKPLRSPQGYEISMATNHFGHFINSVASRKS